MTSEALLPAQSGSSGKAKLLFAGMPATLFPTTARCPSCRPMSVVDVKPYEGVMYVSETSSVTISHTSDAAVHHLQGGASEFPVDAAVTLLGPQGLYGHGGVIQSRGAGPEGV